MSRNKNESKSEGNVGMYIAAGVIGAAAAAIGYYFGKNSEPTHTNSVHGHLDNPPYPPRPGPRVAHRHGNASDHAYVDKDGECAICLKTYKGIKVLSCNHKFHEGCIDKWYKECDGNGREFTCPKCNQVVEFI